MNVVEVRNLVKYYGEHLAIKDVNLEVKKGEILGFIGPNGAGKSTVIRVLMGLLNKESGTALVLGRKPSHLINKHIGYLPSEVNLFQELTVYQQLEYFGKIRKSDLSRIEELSEKLQLDLSRKIKELSFGNKKKVGIIASLLGNPKLLILDEATSGLDPLIQQTFLNLLLEEKRKGVAILLSSHVLSEVEKICDRVCLIKNGETIISDTIENIKLDSYRKVYIKPNLKFELLGLELLDGDKEESIYSFKGDINTLINYLSKFNLESLLIEELDLNEIFLHFYDRAEDDDQ